MLHRSFKPAKCKTSLKLATSRLKLLKNKKDAQLKQMKREVAQLLESGQDQSARIRVEHVVREEKTLAAYDLLEIYCELIAARLPIIESQKNCPIDLKEAITSVVFATPRCADIPELQDVRKNFTAKYGKEFVSAATELRPQCGVSRLLVEKLSANAPDGPTKIKILSAIAEEHNIKWDPKSFGETELKPHADLLNGPNTFEKASRMQTEPSIVQPPPSNIQAPPTPEQRPNAPVNFEHNTRPPSTSSESGAQAPMPTPHHPGVRPLGTKSEMMDIRHSYSGDGNSFPTDRKHWNMEFKDATAAAQAAAESAERASMAARAAAELSIRAQYSTESQKSNIPSSRDEGPTKNDHDNPDEDIDKLMKDFLKGARYSQTSPLEEEAVKAERSAGFSGNNLMKESIGSDVEFVISGHSGTQTDSFNYFAEESIRKQNSSVSSRSRTKGDTHSQYSSEEADKGETGTGFSGMNMNEQSIGSGAEFFSRGQVGMESDSFNYFAEESIWKKGSSVSSHSHSSSRGDDYDVSSFSNPKYETGGSEDPFHPENVHTDTAKTSSYSNAAVVFDDPVSDDDHVNVFDTPNDATQQFEPYPTSPVRESPSHIQFDTDTWSPKQNMSGVLENFPSEAHVSVEGHSPPKFDESSTKSAKPNEFSPLTFDESEGPSSESEDEVDSSRLDRKTDPGTLRQRENIFFRTPNHSQRESHGLTGSFLTEKGDSVSDRKEDFTYSSDDEWVQVNKQGTEFSGQAQSKFGFDEKPIHQSSAKLAEFQVISNDITGEPFDNQAGERKNHQFAQTSRPSLDNEVKASNNTFTPKSSNNMKDDELLRQSSSESGNKLKFGTLTGGLRHKGYPHPPYSKSPSGDASSFKQEAEDSVTSIENSPSIPSVKSSYKSGVRAEMETKSSLGTPIADSDSDSDDFEEELLRQNLSSRKEPNRSKSTKEVDNKLRLRAPVTFFDSEDNDSEEDIPQQTFNRTGRGGSGLSRRTKATPSSGRSSHSKATVGSEASEPNSEVDARKTPSRSSHDSETPLNLGSQTGKSVHRKSPEPRAEKQSTSRPKTEFSNSRSSYPSETPTNPSYRTEYSSNLGRSYPEPRAAKQSGSTPMPESSDSMRKDNLKSSAFEPPSNRASNVQSSAKQPASKPRQESNFSTRNDNLKSSAMEQPSSPLRTVTPAGTESPKYSTSSGELPSRESSLKKASHVHPKLPDYDTLAAQFQSLRSNR
ncbi:hypothetical protein Vadar_005806 [Vaccinium darrowii]|uniref:Uncharacterized protein n=1 Tax=Vaccinium darrowii TaxID=229202 RepID=A0ACB7YD51_9ERIC|nr:hypothetical protein Vadar_005806 [Vaccinium darrowii]